MFRGSARLAKALAAVGFASLGIDYGGNKDTPQYKTIQIDLGTTEGQDLFGHIISWIIVKSSLSILRPHAEQLPEPGRSAEQVGLILPHCDPMITPTACLGFP